MRDTSDMAKETIRTLDTLGLTRWFKVPEFLMLNVDEY